MGNCLITKKERKIKIQTIIENNRNNLEKINSKTLLINNHNNFHLSVENKSSLSSRDVKIHKKNKTKSQKSIKELSLKGDYTIENQKILEYKKFNFFRRINYFKRLKEKSIKHISLYLSFYDKFKLQFIDKKLFSLCEKSFDFRIFEILKYLKKITKPKFNYDKMNIKEKLRDKKETNFYYDDFSPKCFQREMIALLRRFSNYEIDLLSEAFAIYIFMLEENFGYLGSNHIEINSKYNKKTLEIYLELSKIFKEYDFTFCFSGNFDFEITNSKITRNSHNEEKFILQNILKNARNIRFNFQQYNVYYKHSKDDTIHFLKMLIENQRKIKIKNCKLNLDESLDYLIKYCESFPNSLEFFNFYENFDEKKVMLLFDLNKDSLVRIDDRFFHNENVYSYLDQIFFKQAKLFKNKNNCKGKNYFQIDKIFLKDLEKLDNVEYVEIITYSHDFFCYFKFLPSRILYLTLEANLDLFEIESVFKVVKELKTLQYLKFRFRQRLGIIKNIEDFKEINEVEENNMSDGNLNNINLENSLKINNPFLNKSNVNNNFYMNKNSYLNGININNSPKINKNENSQINFSYFGNERQNKLKLVSFYEDIKNSFIHQHQKSPLIHRLNSQQINVHKDKFDFLEFNSHNQIYNTSNSNVNCLSKEKNEKFQIFNSLKNMIFQKASTPSIAIFNSSINNIYNVSTIVEEFEKSHKVEESKKLFFGKFIEKESVNFYVDNIIDIEIPNKYKFFDHIYEITSFILKNRNDKKFFDVRFDLILLNEFCEYLDKMKLKGIKDKIKIISYIRNWPQLGEKFVAFKKVCLPFDNLILINIDFKNLLNGEKANKSMSLHINRIMYGINEELEYVFKPLKKLIFFYVTNIEEKYFNFNNFPIDFLENKKVLILNILPKERNNYYWETNINKLDYM